MKLPSLDQVKACDISLYTVAFLAVIAPGFLVIYHYKPVLFHQLDILKLITLSASLTTPVLLVNWLLILASFDQNQHATQESSDAQVKFTFMVSLAITFVIYYVAFSLAYLMDLRFRTMVFSILGLEIFFGMLWILFGDRLVKDKIK